MQRRAFLERSAALASGVVAATAIPSPLAAALGEPLSVLLPAPRADVARDEAFWSKVRAMYDVDPSLLDLDHGNSGLTTRAVLDRYLRNARLLNSAPNVHYPRLMSDSSMYETVNGFLGVKAPDDVAFIPNATQALNTVLHGFPLMRGDEVLVTDHEYPDMIATLELRAKRDGIVVRTVKVPAANQDGGTLVRSMEAAITSRTKLALISHVSAWNGEVLPVTEVCAMLRRRNVASCVDAAQSVGYLDVNFSSIGCDFLALSWHKAIGAPIATGALAMRQKWFGVVQPLHPPTWDVGKFPIEMYAWTGSVNLAAYSGVPVAIGVQRQIGIANKLTRSRYLGEYWQSRLARVARIRLLTPTSAARSMGFASFAVEGMKSSAVVKQLHDKYQINVQSKAERPYKPFPEAIRVTPHPYTTLKELDRFVAAVKAVVA